VRGIPESRAPEKGTVVAETASANTPVRAATESQPAASASTAGAQPIAQNSGPATMPATGENLTLNKLILTQVQRELNSGPDDVRVSFETISPFLEQPPAAGRRWVCRTLTRVPLGTVQFEAQLVEGAKVIERLTVQTKVEKRQLVLVATGKLARGDLVTPDKMRMQEAWLDRRLPTLFVNMGEALGLEAQKDVEIGAMLDTRDFKPLLMAHRNDTVNVIYVAGALEVQMSGQAMADARLKEQIEIRNPKTGERYTATMVAKGIAVAGGTLTEEQERMLRETR
jgi:flagella basal body P-ring formation protein FlgA